MSDSVPPIDGGSGQTDVSAGFEELELEVLQLEAKLKRIQSKEQGQRYQLRWVATFVGLIVIVGMAAMMSHLLHQIFWGPFTLVSPAFSVAIVVAPIFSITGITIALFVGAFRKFEDGDMEAISSSAVSGARLLK